MRPLKDLIELAKEAEKLQGMKETHKLLGRRIELLECKLAKSGFGSADHGPLFPPPEANETSGHKKGGGSYTIENSFGKTTPRPRKGIEGKEHVLYLSNGYIKSAKILGLGVVEFSQKYNQHALWIRPKDVPRVRAHDSVREKYK